MMPAMLVPMLLRLGLGERYLHHAALQAAPTQRLVAAAATTYQP